MKIDAARFGYTGTLTQEFVDFARRRFVNATLYKGDERRRETRHPMMLPVFVVPVDDHQHRIGDSFEAITRDVSSCSIGLFHPNPLAYDRLVIHMTLADTAINLAIAVTWTRPMGPFYGSAGTYAAKLRDFPFALP